MKQLTVNLFRDPSGGHRISTYHVEQGQEPQRLETFRTPPDDIASVGFWIDITAPDTAMRADFLVLLRSARSNLADPTSLPAQTLWSTGRATMPIGSATISMGGGLFPQWTEYLRRFDLAVNVIRDAPPMTGLDR